jgi:cytoskeletal protein CcmA (bactofilin family)
MARTIISVLTGQKDGPSAADTAAGIADKEALAGASTAIVAERSVMTLGKFLSFKGELSADEDMVLLGRVEGSITHTESLTLGVGSVVIGNLRARVITVRGTVEGDLEASDSINIAPTANVTGDLTAPRVNIVEGAMFNGSVRMSRATVAKQTPVDVLQAETALPRPATAVPLSASTVDPVPDFLARK